MRELLAAANTLVPERVWTFEPSRPVWIDDTYVRVDTQARLVHEVAHFCSIDPLRWHRELHSPFDPDPESACEIRARVLAGLWRSMSTGHGPGHEAHWPRHAVPALVWWHRRRWEGRRSWMDAFRRLS